MKPMEFFLVGLTLFVFTNTKAQNIYVHAEQKLNFGDFYLTNDSRGEITINKTGNWTASGNINLLKSSHHPAVFIISTDSQEPIKVKVQAFVQKLYNTKGGEMHITLLNFEPSVYTIQTNFPVQLLVGATLVVNPRVASSSGNYGGAVSLTVSNFND